MGEALAPSSRVISCFLTIDIVGRKGDTRHERSRYKALLIARGSGTVMYTSRVCDTREQAGELAKRYLTKNVDRLSVESATIHR
jgi:hypothetical protein